MSNLRHDVLAAAAESALMAPSILNTQPWRWSQTGPTLELYADRRRQLARVDPDGRMLLLSCGAALHHARVSIGAAGWQCAVDRLVSDFGDDGLARISLGQRVVASAQVRELHDAIARRHTDRRPFTDDPLPDEAMVQLRQDAEAEGLRLHRVRLEQMPALAAAVLAAGDAEMASADYLAELSQWINRPPGSQDGVPVDTTVRPVPRRVAVRSLTLPPYEGVDVPPYGDRGASYLILYGPGDAAGDWLRAGEATSAALLRATALGLSTAPISDVIEVEQTRARVRALLAGLGHPYLVLRCGFAGNAGELGRTSRRTIEDVTHPDGHVS